MAGAVPKFSRQTADLSSPITALRSVTPNVSADLPDGVCKAIWVGGAGNVEILAEDDTATVVIAAVNAGQLLPIRAKSIRSGSTTATSIVALY